MKGGTLMKYILMTLRKVTDQKSVIYGYDICIAQECRFFEEINHGHSVGWYTYHGSEKLRECKQMPIPKFETINDAIEYFDKHIESFKGDKKKSLSYIKLFTRVTTIEKLDEFLLKSKPWLSYTKDDDKYLEEVLGPSVF